MKLEPTIGLEIHCELNTKVRCFLEVITFIQLFLILI